MHVAFVLKMRIQGQSFDFQKKKSGASHWLQHGKASSPPPESRGDRGMLDGWQDDLKPSRESFCLFLSCFNFFSYSLAGSIDSSSCHLHLPRNTLTLLLDG